MSIQSDFLRRSISRLLVTSILCSSFSPTFAMKDNGVDDDGDAGVVSIKVATPVQVPVVKEDEVYQKESCRGVDVDFLTEEGKEIYAAALLDEVMKLKDSPVLDIVFASMSDHDRQRMKLVSKDWQRTIKTTEERVGTTRIRPSYSNHNIHNFEAEKMDMERTAYYRVGEALYTEEQLRFFRMKKFAHLVFDDVALPGKVIDALSWGSNTSVEIEVTDAQALERLLARTAENTALHVGVALPLTDRELTSEGKLTDKAITDPLLRNDQTQSYQSLEGFLTSLGQVDADARSIMDLASLAVDVDSVSTAVKLLTRIHALRNLRTTPPMVTLFINQFVDEFTSLPDLQNNTETKKGAKSEDVKELRALEQKLAAQLKLFSLNDVYQGVRGRIGDDLIYDPSVGLHLQGRLSLAGIFEVINPILQEAQTSAGRSIILRGFKVLTARASTLKDVFHYMEQLPCMYTLSEHDSSLRDALIDTPPSKRPILVDAVNSTLASFIAEARQQAGVQKSDLELQISFRPLAINLRKFIEVISLDDYPQIKPHLLYLAEHFPLHSGDLLKISQRDRVSCAIAALPLFGRGFGHVVDETASKILMALSEIPAGERTQVGQLVAGHVAKFRPIGPVDPVKVIKVLKPVAADQRAHLLETELSTPYDLTIWDDSDIY